MTNTLTSYNRTPRYVNAISPPYPFQVVDEDGNIVNLTGASTSRWMLWLQDLNNPATTIEGTGTFSLTDATNGKAQYQWSVTDLATVGIYYLSISIRLPSEAGYRQLAPQIVVIAQLPGAQFMATQDVNILQILGAPISSSNPVPTSGPITIANGSDVAEGSTSDAAYTGSGNTTVVASLKGIFAVLRQIMPVASVALDSPPAETNAGTNTALSLASTAYSLLIQNNSPNDLNVEFGGTATSGSLVIKSGTALFWNEPITSFGILTTNATNINGSSSGNIVIKAFG